MWLEEVERLLAAAPVQRRVQTDGLMPAAALVPLYVVAGHLWVLLTRRPDSLPQHGGQYSFPGGVCEEDDDDEVATALRQAHREIRLDPALVVILGHLNDVWTPTGFLISPVVGAIPYPPTVEPASKEIEAVVPVPFTYLANPEAIEERELEIRGVRVLSPLYHYRSHHIWGATARIIADLVARISGGAAATMGQ
jgi:8-oxo-dGTP pyrophosphatase MutT (NUDIX family)